MARLSPDPWFVAASLLLLPVLPSPAALGGGGCLVDCERSSAFEQEGCGEDLNGGCDSAAQVFQQVHCPTTICGTLWAHGGARDSDWYWITVPDLNGDGTATVHATLRTNVPANVRIVPGNECPTGPPYAQVHASQCLPATASAIVPAPGSYYVVVTPGTPGGAVLDGWPCLPSGNEYLLDLRCGPCPPCAPLPQDTAAWWPLDELTGGLAHDIIGGHHGTWVGAPVPNRTGYVRSSLRMESGSHIEVPHHSALNPGIDDFSIMLTFWWDPGLGTDARILADKTYQSFNVLWGYRLSVSNHQFTFWLQASGPGQTVTASPVLSEGWHHVAVTLDRDDPAGGVLYLNGFPVATFDPTAHPGAIGTGDPLRLGGPCLDEVLIVHRALSHAEVSTIAQAGPAGICRPAAPGDACSVTCGRQLTPEPEACCDDTNRGCDLAPWIFTESTLPVAFCGDLWADGGLQDADWYRVHVPDLTGDGRGMLEATLTAGLPARVRIQTDHCPVSSVLDEALAGPCAPATVSACVPAPQTYLVSVRPWEDAQPLLDGFACGGPRSIYRLDMNGGGPTPCIPPPPGLVAWWPMDDAQYTQMTERVHGNHGSWPPGALSVPWAFVSSGVRFMSLWSVVPHDPVLSPGTDDFTVALWLWLNPSAGSIPPSTFVLNQGAHGYRFGQIGQGGGTSRLHFTMEDDSGWSSWHSSGLIPRGWSFVAVTVERADPAGGTFFINGQHAGTFDPTVRPGALVNAAALRLGWEFNNLGAMDEVAIWHRALSHEEIHGLFRAGASGMCKETPCPADLDGDGDVDFSDLLVLLAAWGPCSGCPEDLNGDGIVDFQDVLILQSGTGPCPP